MDSNLVDPSHYLDWPHIAPNHIESGTGRLLPFATVSADKVTSAKHLFQPGHILYSKIRPYLAKAVVVDFQGLCSADMYPISTTLDSRFLHQWLISPMFTAHASQQQGRTVLPKINQSALAKLQVPVPPDAEQRRIVTKLEALQTRSRAAREALDAVGPLLEKFRQSVLAAAFDGRLLRRTTPWRTALLGDVISTGPQNGLYKPQSAYGTGAQIIRIDDYRHGRLRPLGELRRVDLDDQEKCKFELTSGDLLINRVNSPKHLGKPTLVPIHDEPLVFESNIMRCALDTALVVPEFVLYYLLSARGSGELKKNAKHAVNQASINQTDVRGVLIPLPPLDEQRVIVRRIEQVLGAVREMSIAWVDTGLETERLAQAILAKAFRGELVPQDPNDEPAAALLARSHAATPETAKPTKRGRKPKAS